MNRTSALIGWCAAIIVACWPVSASMADDSGAPGNGSVAAGSVAAESTESAGSGIDTSLPAAAADKNCVMLRNIDRTDVVDDYNILFYMRGPDIYHVRLPHRCPGLRMADSFMYSTSLNVLCDLDIIRPLRNFGGSFRPSGACGLGRFTPITKEEVALLKNKDVEVEPERAEADVETLAAGESDVDAGDAEDQE
jgi:hypothetical protein